MNKKIIVGLDSSNYTSSCAFCDENGNIIENIKLLLPVKSGENGLRQSDAVFSHIKNYQNIANYIKQKATQYKIEAIGYSARPRDVEGSYMPCFLVGETIAEMLSAFYNARTFRYSHQAGHIRAAIYSSKAPLDDEDFLAFHVSGGTTEIVLVKNNGYTYDIEKIGGSCDLNAGQVIDRIGVLMGMSFPCGKEIEQYALQNTKKLPNNKICVRKYSCNLSGLENLALKLYKDTNDKALTSAFILDFIGKTIETLSVNLREEFPNMRIIYAGGVMSNTIIKERILSTLQNVYFAEPNFSTDNAAGIALLTYKEYQERS